MAEILTSDKTGARAARPAEGSAWFSGPLLVFGAILALAGMLDVALLWYPPRFGEADWEFGIIAQTLDALPLPTMGFVMLAGGAHLRGSRGLLRAAAIVAGLVALFLLACALIFVLDVPQALTAMQRDVRLAPGIKRVLFKAAVFLTSYTTGYGVVAVMLWRRLRPARV